MQQVRNQRGGGLPCPFAKTEVSRRKNRDFSCWVRIKSIFQRKKLLSCKLLARNQLHYKLMIQHLTRRCIFEIHQSKKNLDISTSHLAMARSLKNSRNLKLSSFFQGSSLLEKLCFLSIKQIRWSWLGNFSKFSVTIFPLPAPGENLRQNKMERVKQCLIGQKRLPPCQQTKIDLWQISNNHIAINNDVDNILFDSWLFLRKLSSPIFKFCVYVVPTFYAKH